ncbi:16S rRNA (cytosine(1402)-N(4))-methyltransferase [Candidatus Nomurabacteria bacterium RIFCSPHIGHO2_01_FULL_40_12]|uniref:Ribosomal RNA small subunit methyltransferase H n=1 Tax=Candidatus Nomurabacteria bacterium RIFCSPHIGHO2_01_FULL_40_12 TaxID=1801737 RepID=A0A1F6UYN5_9BACT|nr:MAG: 16S rRNA (cytosine(1402)-N(4))-methyltransferase [Candidatus Nomurabacteria bacterium RIFCSPHIGHO2_01_FULL_40_12]
MHKTVLLQEAIEGLNLKDGATVIDATFGGGGHSLEICKRYRNVKIIALDQDKGVFEKAKDKFKDLDCGVTFVNANFRELNHLENFGAFALGDERTGNPRRLNFLNGSASVDAIIFDLGLSSDQLENSGRGFSFLIDEPLLMQMKNSEKENSSGEDVTARDAVNTWSEKNLADIIYGYGEEQFARRIARGILEARKKSEIKTTFDLVKVIEESVPNFYRRGRIHPATRTFQALRIAVNDELGALQTGLEKGFDMLKTGGRISVISFHSLEDRIVKRFYKNKENEGVARLINKKVILPGVKELKENIRARSAKLRIIEKIQ